MDFHRRMNFHRPVWCQSEFGNYWESSEELLNYLAGSGWKLEFWNSCGGREWRGEMGETVQSEDSEMRLPPGQNWSYRLGSGKPAHPLKGMDISSCQGYKRLFLFLLAFVLSPFLSSFLSKMREFEVRRSYPPTPPHPTPHLPHHTHTHTVGLGNTNVLLLN